MVELQLELPCNILRDIDLFQVLGAAMRKTLKHLVMLKRLEDDYECLNSVLPSNNLPTIVRLLQVYHSSVGKARIGR